MKEENKFNWGGKEITVNDKELVKIGISVKAKNFISGAEHGAWEDDGRPESKYHPHNFFSGDKPYVLVPKDAEYIEFIVDSMSNAIDIERDHVNSGETAYGTYMSAVRAKYKIVHLGHSLR